MKGTLKIDYVNEKIIMSREFAKAAEDTTSPEYRHLQEVRSFNIDFTVVRKTIKKNIQKETWKGLTYEYMIRYIITKEPEKTKANVLKEFSDIKLISECHSKGKRYPLVKKWFLNKYPEIIAYGMPEVEELVLISEPLQPEINIELKPAA